MSDTASTHMRREIDEIPTAARRLATPQAQRQLQAVADILRQQAPCAVVTIARGSSDHAATCLEYAIAISAGIPVASMGSSVASIYGAALRVKPIAVFGISQSGKSRDLNQMMRGAAAGGAHAVAFTNTAESELARHAAHTVDILAGPEHAVAATKSFTNSVLAGLWVLAHWQQDDALLAALQDMPDRLQTALAVPVDALVDALAQADRLLVLGRGPTLGVAMEVALKAMEVCGITAMAYSSAEVLHGPATVIRDGYPVLAIPGADGDGLAGTLQQLRDQGARVLDEVEGPEPAHAALPALERVVTLYGALEAASRLRGRNPDRPEGLNKVTDTI